MEMSKRAVIKTSCLGVVGLAGCSRGGGDTDENNDGEVITLEESEPECTDVYISDFNWESKFLAEDEFQATLVNQGDIAGTVTVELRFWRSERQDTLEGTIQRSISIGAQDTESVTIEANAPTDATEWASMSVVEQDCR